MAVHKIQTHEKTACGLDVFLNEIEASRDWNEVICKNCKKKRPKLPLGNHTSTL